MYGIILDQARGRILVHVVRYGTKPRVHIICILYLLKYRDKMNPLLRMLEQVPMVPSSNCEPQRSLLVFEILDTLHRDATPVNNLCCVT